MPIALPKHPRTIVRAAPPAARTGPIALLVCLGAAFLAACARGGIGPPPALTPDAGWTYVRWSRTGGSGDFCDEMTITADGLATFGSCKDEFPGLRPPRPLPPDEWGLLQGWTQGSPAFSEEFTDPTGGHTITLDFSGVRAGEAGAAEKEVLRDFIAIVFGLMRKLSAEGCTVRAISPFDAYAGPDLDADGAGGLAEGETAAVFGQTIDGWLAIAPPGFGSATQLFKPRWLAPNAQIAREDGCMAAPRITADAADACYLAAAAGTPVQIAPSARSATLGQLPAGSVLPVNGRTENGWLRVDLAGSVSGSVEGWVQDPGNDPETACAELPVVEP